MMATPPPERKSEPPQRHVGATVGESPSPSVPILAPRGITVDRGATPKDTLDEAAELFREIFKGDIVP